MYCNTYISLKLFNWITVFNKAKEKWIYIVSFNIRFDPVSNTHTSRKYTINAYILGSYFSIQSRMLGFSRFSGFRMKSFSLLYQLTMVMFRCIACQFRQLIAKRHASLFQFNDLKLRAITTRHVPNRLIAPLLRLRIGFIYHHLEQLSI